MTLPTPPPAGYAPVVAAEARTDAGPAQACAYGVAGQAFQSSNASSAAVAVTDAPPTGLTLVITDLIVSVGSNALTVTFTDQVTSNVILVLQLAANSTYPPITPRGKIRLPKPNSTLQVQTSGTGAIAVTAVYYAEP